MKKIKFMLEYQCSPIWVENEEGELLGNGLPCELATDYELSSLLDIIHKTFDDLYENNEVYFGYHGFSNKNEKEEFINQVNKAIDMLKRKAGNSYLIQIDLNEANL